ncbi:hypothetical protein LOK49_LG14G00216 [Camellia lanceoleosa]|uniref:Uncharacterized protein n=1 Tax=Camellia lanceoleosa TaxID=1840588 RepID=A0ACC0FDU3_9ERIC|nr:hypothetical protein LOK49_LG14G00216 [Camellia lanceoleosa]
MLCFFFFIIDTIIVSVDEIRSSNLLDDSDRRNQPVDGSAVKYPQQISEASLCHLLDSNRTFPGICGFELQGELERFVEYCKGKVEMAMVSKTRNMLEGLVREGSFKWLIKNRTSFAEEFEEMGSSPSAGTNWIPELSPVANIVVRRCSKILGISSSELRENFVAEASDSIKHTSRFARNILEYCCFRALALSTQVDEDVTVGIEAFSRIAPAVPIIANEKKILEVDGTVTSQPVLEHVGISTWPGRLILTDYALYFEALRVVSYDKAKRYDLSEDLKQVVKPELTGPWGTRLFDKAVFYKSVSLSEPIVMEFPELKGHTRRDFWLAIIREILYVHRFVHKFQITGVEHDEALLKATLGILRVQALREISSASPLCYESLLMFNLCDQRPGGDLVLEALANMSSSRELDRTNNSNVGGGMYSISALAMATNLGSVFGTSSNARGWTLCC